jgi:polynucleotide 5'-hydroxyl-kinase GRC3/NOL9
MAKVVVPAEWGGVEAAAEAGGSLLVVGASDTGKSTFARWLYRRLCVRFGCVAYLDADIGQSSLGLPTTMTVALRGRRDERRFPPQGPRAGYFVGSITPRGHFLPMVVGLYRLREWAAAHGAGAVVVDTTGLIDPRHGGAALKQWKIELLRPALVVGLGGAELSPILEPLSRADWTRVVALEPSEHVQVRGREARIARRRARWVTYFRGAGLVTFSLAQMPVFEPGRLCLSRLVGLQDEAGLLRGLGVVEGVDWRGGNLAVRTPLETPEDVCSLRVGAVRLDPATGVESP